MPIGAHSSSQSPTPAGSGKANSGFTDIAEKAAGFVTGIINAVDWKTLRKLVYSLLGPFSFTAGMVYGMGENFVGSVISLLALVKTFALAQYWESQHGSISARAIALLSPIGMVDIGVSATSYLSPALKQTIERKTREAHEESQAIVKGVQYAFSHPGEIFGTSSKSIEDKVKKYMSEMEENPLAGSFEAGELFGELLFDLLLLLDGALGAELISNTLSCQSHLMMALRQVDGLNVAVHHARHRHHKPSQEPCISDKHPGVSMLKGESHGTPLTPCAGL